MYNILIVDDEKLTVDAIKLTLSTEEIEIDKIFKAYSGEEAYDKILKNKIDIVVSDIRMPGMNGGELIQKIRNYSDNIKCIMLSGYADFTYAQEAIRNKTLHYLLKPVRDGELISSIKDAIDELKKESDYINAELIVDENKPILQSVFLQELLLGHEYPKNKISEKTKMLDLDFNFGDEFMMLLFQFEGSFYNENNKLLNHPNNSIDEICKEFFCDKFYVWTCKENPIQLIVLLKEKDHIEDNQLSEDIYQIVRRQAAQFTDKIKKLLAREVFDVSIGSGIFPTDITEAYQYCQFHQSTNKKDQTDFRGHTAIKSESQINVKPLTDLYNPPLLIHLLESGRWSAAKKKIKEACHELSVESMTGESVLGFFHMISNSFIYIAHKRGKLLESIIGDEVKKITSRYHFDSIDMIESWSLSIIELFKNNKEHSQDGHAEIIQNVQFYIEENIHEDISLNTVAGHVYLHPVYLSKIYKMETGESLSDFIYSLRMNRAAYLLTHTQKRIYEVAKSIGFENTSYFIRVFRNCFKITPLEYREEKGIQEMVE